MSRKRTIALLAAFATLAALLSACGGGGGGGSSEDPQKVIESATFEGVESGDIGMTMNVDSKGKHGGEMKVDLSGPFQSTGKKSLPELELALTANGEANGEKVDFEGGITVLNDRAYVGFNGKQYEIDPATFGFVKSAIEEGRREGEGQGAEGGANSACQKAAASIDLNKIVENLENEGGEEVEGVETTKVSGDLNPEGAVDSIIKLSETPACASDLEMAGPLPLEELKEQATELTGGLKKSHVEIYVGESDHIIRKVVAELAIEPKGSGETVEVELELTLGKVNEKQTINAPANAQPLEKLFGELGINPNQILGLLQGGGTEGLGSLLEGLTGEGGGSSSGGGKSGSGSETGLPSLENSKAFTECLNEVESASEIQKCASLVE